ncbi:MAG: aldo/keto reductase, partial [Lentisphaerae bacterium]|nr:aldo/keto reductase [Lentisphaerota bacterium]
LDQSLKRLGLPYVDIFYSHRPDNDTPLDETLGALETAVRSGRALYVGISSYSPEKTRLAAQGLRALGVPCLIHQPKYSMFNRWVEPELLDVLEQEGMGAIAFCPLAQGLLTSRYLDGIPPDSRAAGGRFLTVAQVTAGKVAQARELNKLAAARGQTLAQMALTWVLRDERVTSALIGASRPEQIRENFAAVTAARLTDDELIRIDAILDAGAAADNPA